MRLLGIAAAMLCVSATTRIARSIIDAGGGHSGTTGIAGIRVNHNLDLHVGGFRIETN